MSPLVLFLSALLNPTALARGVAWLDVQVLACDPEDMIIADASSTKAGVSVMLELGASSSSLDVYQPPKVG